MHKNHAPSFLSDATNLMRAFDSNQPRINESDSSRDAEITVLAFFLGCHYMEAKRWYPFFKKTLQLADSMASSRQDS